MVPRRRRGRDGRRRGRDAGLIVSVGPEHVLESARVLRAALEPHLHRDWSVRAGDLKWSCRDTLLHAADFWYAVELSSQSRDWLPPMLKWREGLTPEKGLAAHDAAASLLAAVMRGVSPEARGYHGQPTDAEGFAAMHCDEVLVHGYVADHFTLLPAEQELLANKTGSNRFGFVVLLKYFQWEGRFPEHLQDVPRAVVDHVGHTLTMPAERYLQYDLSGRSARYHKEQIRQWTGFRLGTTADADAITTWLYTHTRVDDATPARLTVRALERYKALHIEPPTPGRLEWMTHVAQRTLEEQFFTTLSEALKPATRQMIDTLLTESSAPLSLSGLKADAGRRSLDSLEAEVEKLRHLQGLELPHDLLTPISTRYLQRLKLRVVAETLHELRRHPDPIRYGLVALFCAVRAQEIADNLTDMLLHLVHKMGVNAEKRVEKELLADFKRVTGKTGLLFHLAEVSLDHPKGQVDEVIYPAVGRVFPSPFGMGTRRLG